MSTYKDHLVRTIKLLAKDLYENAEKYVGDKEYRTSMDIWLHLPCGADRDCPIIEVNTEYLPDEYVLAVDPDSEESTKELEKPFPTF